MDNIFPMKQKGENLLGQLVIIKEERHNAVIEVDLVTHIYDGLFIAKQSTMDKDSPFLADPI